MAPRGYSFVEDVCPRMFTQERCLQILAGCALFLSVMAALFIFREARPVLMPLVAAFVISVILAPAAARLRALGLPETGAAALLTLIAAASLIAVVYFAGKPAFSWAQDLPALAEQARQKLSRLESAITTVKEVSDQVGEITNLDPEAGEEEKVVVREDGAERAMTRLVPGVLVQILFTIVLVFFLLAARTDLKRKVVAMHRNYSGKVRAVRMFDRIERRIGRFMLTMLIINALLGAATGAAMAALGMPSPEVWGLLAGILNFVPYVGPAILTLLLGLGGLVHFDSVAMAATPMLSYAALNFIESNFVTPMFLGARMKITPLSIIISVALLTWLWGPVGGLLAIPLLIVFKAICDSIPLLNPIGILIGELRSVEPRPLLGRRKRALAAAE